MLSRAFSTPLKSILSFKFSALLAPYRTHPFNDDFVELVPRLCPNCELYTPRFSSVFNSIFHYSFDEDRPFALNFLIIQGRFGASERSPIENSNTLRVRSCDSSMLAINASSGNEPNSLDVWPSILTSSISFENRPSKILIYRGIKSLSIFRNTGCSSAWLGGNKISGAMNLIERVSLSISACQSLRSARNSLSALSEYYPPGFATA